MRDFAQKARECSTENAWNRLHIDLENVLAPQELAQLARYEQSAGPFIRTAKWLDKLRRLSPDVFDAPRCFQAEPLHANLTLYRGAPYARNRRLLFTFAGNAGRVMLPMPVFLQLFDPLAWDVLVVCKQRGQSYCDAALQDIAPAAAGLLDLAEYRSVACLGTSSGGFPAIVAALRIGAAVGVSVGGSPPPADRFAFPAGLGGSGSTRLVYVHGADFERDGVSAAILARHAPGEILAVPGVARHNVLAALIAEGTIGALLDSIGISGGG